MMDLTGQAPDVTRGDWSPLTRYVWTRKQMQQWADFWGHTCMFKGVKYRIKYEVLVPGRYNVWFEKEPTP